MSLIPLLLVAFSGLAHAYWNYLVKREQGTQAFLALSMAAQVILFLPLAVVVIAGSPPVSLLPYWWLIAVAAVGLILFYVTLGRMYASGDLSVVYPVMRAGLVAILPPLALVFLGERIDGIGIAAIGLIILGILAVQLEKWDSASVKALLAKSSRAAVSAALIAAFVAAVFSIWDKFALQFLPVVIYYYVYTAVAAVIYLVMVVARSSRQRLAAEFRKRPGAIIQVGLLSMVSYFLVLAALQMDKASYVIAVRQISIGFGALMGQFWLGERFPMHRWLGVAILLAGCALISLAK